jgi:hypothetical protein
MIYVPFSTTDLHNWKQQNPSFSDKPQGLIALLEAMFFTHQPTWDDCQQLLQTLFTAEEQDRIQREARKNVLGSDGTPTGTQDLLGTVSPLFRPNWDLNSHADKEALASYCWFLLMVV